MNQRRREALEQMAARGGTEAERQIARDRLSKYKADPHVTAFRYVGNDIDEALGKFAQFMRTGAMGDLRDAVGHKTCACGTHHPAFTACPNTALHERIDREMRSRFQRGTRVYYNRWAYPANCVGTVVGYSKLWGWIRIKFDHLMNPMRVPIYSADGWHLSTEPLPNSSERSRLRQDRLYMEEETR